MTSDTSKADCSNPDPLRQYAITVLGLSKKWQRIAVSNKQIAINLSRAALALRSISSVSGLK